MTIELEIQKFKNELLCKIPFYGDFVMNVDFLPDLSIPTACTDGITIRYNPRFMSSLKEGERNFVLMHEIMHIILMHPTRCYGKNPQIANIAADYIVNSTLERLSRPFYEAGITIVRPSSALFSYIGNDNFENLYSKLLKANFDKENPSEKEIKSKVFSTIKTGNYKNAPVIPGNIFKDVILTPDQLINNSIEEINEATIEKLKEAFEAYTNTIKSAPRANNLPMHSQSPFGSFFIPNEIISLVEVKPIDWKRVLKSFLNDLVEDDETSYVTPERKYIHMDLILPGHGTKEGEPGNIWAFVDTSGSIGKSELDKFITQLYHLAKQFSCSINLAYWDTKVSDYHKNLKSPKSLFEHPPKSTGGTDINCVYEWITTNKIKFDILLILTDGYFGKVKTQYLIPSYKKKTIVVLNNNQCNKDEVLKIGKIAGM